MSHPMWVRGLKLLRLPLLLSVFLVAPHVGAWIETPLKAKSGFNPASHPMWVRGLKQYS